MCRCCLQVRFGRGYGKCAVPVDKKQAMPDSQRYILSVTGSTPIRFDTLNGKTWMLVGISASERSWVPVKDEDAPESADVKEKKISDLMQHIEDLQKEVNDLRSKK
jgi:hypothetical protein